jgi:hypothetical protein
METREICRIPVTFGNACTALHCRAVDVPVSVNTAGNATSTSTANNRRKASWRRVMAAKRRFRHEATTSSFNPLIFSKMSLFQVGRRGGIIWAT